MQLSRKNPYVRHQPDTQTLFAGREAEALGGDPRRALGLHRLALCRPGGRAVPAPVAEGGEPRAGQGALDQGGGREGRRARRQIRAQKVSAHSRSQINAVLNL